MEALVWHDRHLRPAAGPSVCVSVCLCVWGGRGVVFNIRFCDAGPVCLCVVVCVCVSMSLSVCACLCLCRCLCVGGAV